MYGANIYLDIVGLVASKFNNAFYELRLGGVGADYADSHILGLLFGYVKTHLHGEDCRIHLHVASLHLFCPENAVEPLNSERHESNRLYIQCSEV